MGGTRRTIGSSHASNCFRGMDVQGSAGASAPADLRFWTSFLERTRHVSNSSIVTELSAAVRALRRAPLVSGSAILCVALGIGATAAISSAISRALLQPLPFRSPERLVTVYRTTPHFDTGPFSPANYLDLARETPSARSARRHHADDEPVAADRRGDTGHREPRDGQRVPHARSACATRALAQRR